jgi:hypothetical protein
MSSTTYSLRSSPQKLYDQSATQLAPLGSRLILSDGREFVYAQNGNATGVAGNLYQHPTLDATGGAITNHLNCAVAAASIGDKTITVTLGATAVTENYYAEGYLHVVDGTGEGVSYKIKGHPAAESAATVVVTLFDPVIEALVASGTSEVSLIPNPFKAAVIHPSPPTGRLIGVMVRDMTANYYGWFQTKGLCAVLSQGPLVAGEAVIASISTDGAVGPLSATYAVTYAYVGRCVVVRATGEYGTIDLNIQ